MAQSAVRLKTLLGQRQGSRQALAAVGLNWHAPPLCEIGEPATQAGFAQPVEEMFAVDGTSIPGGAHPREFERVARQRFIALT